MEFGFTNSNQRYQEVIAFREAAVADGWSIKPTYSDHESVDRASTLEKDGFKMMIMSRTDIGKWKYEANITIWGPDDLVVRTPPVYDWKEIKRGLRICNNCGMTSIKTTRYGFAGRCCEKCLPEMRKQHEYPGWTN